MLRSLGWDAVIKTENKTSPSTERIYKRELVLGVCITGIAHTDVRLGANGQERILEMFLVHKGAFYFSTGTRPVSRKSYIFAVGSWWFIRLVLKGVEGTFREY